MKIDLIKQLIQEFENSGVYKMKIEVDDLKLELEKPTASMPMIEVPSTTPVVQTKVETVQEVVESPAIASGVEVKSPIVGVFYSSSSPTAGAFVEVGDTVTKGQVLCIVEAMKVMNEIKSPVDGVVTSILVNNDDLVEFDQILMTIEG